MGAAPPGARPLERRACRRKQAGRRPWASLRSLRVSARARRRARRASSATWGPATAVRSPERARRANGPASRRSVGRRAPGFWGISEGAPQQASPVWLRERARQEPQGPAAATQINALACEGLGRSIGAMAPGRGPIAPREVTGAPGSRGPEATAIASLWTSIPPQRVRDWDTVARRVYRGWGGIRRHWCGYAHPRYLGGHPPDALEVIMSRHLIR